MTTREPIDVVDAIFSTRSMRYLKPDPIPDEVIWDLLDAAIRGPTGGNMQQWAWIVVTDRDKKRTIAEWYRQAIMRGYGDRLDETTGAARVLGRGGTVEGSSTIGLDRGNLLSVIHLAEHFAEVPVLVYGVLPDRRRPAPDLDTAYMNGVLAAGPILGAVQNLMLTARAYGIGSVLNGGGAGGHHEELRRLLGLPESALICACVALGYPAKGSFSTPKRQPIEEATHWEAWGQQKPRRP